MQILFTSGGFIFGKLIGLRVLLQANQLNCAGMAFQ
jgi:hypothetical protein